MTAPDLLPCQCGGKVHIDHFKNPTAVVVVCEKCGTDWLGYWSDSERSIAERWNTRATPTPAAMTPEVAKLVEAAWQMLIEYDEADIEPEPHSMTSAAIRLRAALAGLRAEGDGHGGKDG